MTSRGRARSIEEVRPDEIVCGFWEAGRSDFRLAPCRPPERVKNMHLKCKCPHCGTKIRYQVELSSGFAHCPGCKTQFQLPDAPPGVPRMAGQASVEQRSRSGVAGPAGRGNYCTQPGPTESPGERHRRRRVGSAMSQSEQPCAGAPPVPLIDTLEAALAP